MKRLYIMMCLTVFLPMLLTAQQQAEEKGNLLSTLEKFSLSGYGAMNYYNFDWQTDTAKRNAIDNERFILDLDYHWTPRISLSTEIEFEHGGTGVDVEFDRFEEFGEFEYEVSKGGEIKIEQMNLQFDITEGIKFKLGRIKVPFGMMFTRDEPTDYLTATNSEMETAILPENWTENGFVFFGNLGKNKSWKYHLGLVNGLDGSAFNSANWIKRGNQLRFELVNAENFAATARIDYKSGNDFQIGISLYGGNTTYNRPKPDLHIATPVGLGEFHFRYKNALINVSGMCMYGVLGNSEALSNQNRNLSNALNVKRTPVGAAALGAYLEAGITVLGKIGLIKSLKVGDCIVFGRFDYYDTMYKTQGLIFNNPRWERKTITGGLVYKIIDDIHFKVQYSVRKVGAPAPTSIHGGTLENTFIGGFAFEF